MRLEGVCYRIQASTLLDMQFAEIEKWAPTTERAIHGRYRVQPLGDARDRHPLCHVWLYHSCNPSSIRNDIEEAIKHLSLPPCVGLEIDLEINLDNDKPNLQQQVQELQKKARELEAQVQEERQKNERMRDNTEEHVLTLRLEAIRLESSLGDSGN